MKNTSKKSLPAPQTRGNNWWNNLSECLSKNWEKKKKIVFSFVALRCCRLPSVLSSRIWCLVGSNGAEYILLGGITFKKMSKVLCCQCCCCCCCFYVSFLAVVDRYCCVVVDYVVAIAALVNNVVIVVFAPVVALRVVAMVSISVLLFLHT